MRALPALCVAAAYAIFAAATVPLALSDVRERRLPNRPLAAATAAVAGALLAAAALGGEWARLAGAAAASAAYFAALLLLRAASRGGLGGGDVKLGPLLGLALGWVGSAAAALWAPLLVAVGAGAAGLVARRRGRAEFALGPVLLAGAWGGILLGVAAP